MNDVIEYKWANDDDIEVLFEFYEHQLSLSSKVIDLYKWRQQNINASGGCHTYTARCGEKIVGAINVVPVDLICGAQRIKACWQQDSIVDESMRGHGIGKKIVTGAGEGYDLVMAKGISDAMYGLRKKNGYCDVIFSNDIIAVLSPFCHAKSFKSKISLFVLWLFSLCKRLWPRPYLQRTISKVTQFDAAACEWIDKQKNNQIRIKKGIDYLHWRYCTAPNNGYVILCSSDDTGIRGYLVYRQSSHNQQNVSIVDFLCDSNDHDTIVSLVEYVWESIQKDGVKKVYTFATSKKVRSYLLYRGFINLPKTPRFTYKILTDSLTYEYVKALDWNFCYGDGDLELYD